MSASVTEKTASGPIQFQKFHRFFRGQCPEQVGADERPAREAHRSRIQAAACVAEIDGRGDLALGVDGLPHAPRVRPVEDREMVGQPQKSDVAIVPRIEMGAWSSTDWVARFTVRSVSCASL